MLSILLCPVVRIESWSPGYSGLSFWRKDCQRIVRHSSKPPHLLFKTPRDLGHSHTSEPQVSSESPLKNLGELIRSNGTKTHSGLPGSGLCVFGSRPGEKATTLPWCVAAEGPCPPVLQHSDRGFLSLRLSFFIFKSQGAGLPGRLNKMVAELKLRDICFWSEDANHVGMMIDWLQLKLISSSLSRVLCVIQPPLPWSPTFFPSPYHSCSEASVCGWENRPSPSGLCSQGPAPSGVQGQLSLSVSSWASHSSHSL